jgi:galactose-1-phosphate uridylyltransferase (family 1)
MKRTSARLADGREILYFDERDDAVRVLTDPRDLPPVEHRSEVRYDPVQDEWVAVASHRQTRTHLPPPDECPLCPSTPERHTEIPSPDYDVVVFENRFPSFAPGQPAPPSGDLLAIGPGVGRCEVVCFTADHRSSFAALPPARVRTVLAAWIDRTTELGAVPGVEQVFCFENRGEEIGVTLAHPHGQIYAFPFVPPKAARMVEMASRHAATSGGNLFRDVWKAERRAETRVVVSSEHWTAFVPAAARWPVEVHLAPHRDVADLPGLTGAERDDLARVYLDVLGRLDRYFPGPEPLPYISGVFQAPMRSGRDLFRLHLQVFSVLRAPGKLKYLAGVESAMGAWISDTTPERIAARLREVA